MKTFLLGFAISLLAAWVFNYVVVNILFYKPKSDKTEGKADGVTTDAEEAPEPFRDQHDPRKDETLKTSGKV